MNSLVRGAEIPCKKVEVIKPEDQIRCTFRSNPFNFTAKTEMVARGKTILDIVDEFISPKWSTGSIRVCLDGVPVPAQYWQRVRPKAGHEVTIAVTPMRGGGGGTTQAIFGIVLIAAALALGPVGLGWIGGAMALQLAVGGGLSLLGGALQLAFAPSAPTIGALGGMDSNDSQTLFIRGARNQAKPFGVVPRIMGKHRMVPPYAAMPFTEEVGDKQWLYLYFDGGYGPLAMDIADMRIGETPLEQFGIKPEDIEIRHGFLQDEPISIFPNIVQTTGLSIKLTTNWDEKRTNPDVDKIAFQFEYPKGLFGVNDKGDAYSLEVVIHVEYRKVGNSTWLVPEGFPKSVKRTMKAPFLDELSFKPGYRGQFDVRVKRGSAEGDNIRKCSTCIWSALKMTRFEDPVRMDKMFPQNSCNYRGATAKIVMRIMATEKLNGVVDTFSFVGKSILMDYGAWSLDFTDATSPMNGGQFSELTAALPRTIECKATATASGGLFECGDMATSLKGFSLRLVSAITQSWRVDLGGGTTHDVGITGSVGSEHHYALVYDGTNVTFYYDGVQKGQWAHVLNTTKTDVLIGKCQGNMFKGQIRDVRVWKTTRTQSNLQSKMNTVIENRDGNRIAYWRMSEGSGKKVYDYGTSTRHMDFPSSGAPVWKEGPEEARIWEPRPTSNPSSCVLDTLQGSANKRAIQNTGRILWSDFEAFHTVCKLNGWTFNFVFDYKGNVFDNMQLIAATGRAQVTMKDGKHAIIQDIKKYTHRQTFTPANSWDFRGIKMFKERIHALKCQYVSSSLDYETTEAVVYDDGYDEGNATLFASQDFKGTTDKETVRKHGRYLLACTRLRPEAFELTCDFENLVATRGDLVKVGHDVISAGLAFGRIDSVTKDEDGKVIVIALRGSVVMEAGKEYAIDIRMNDASSVVLPVATVAGLQTQLTLVAPSSAAVRADDLYVFGYLGQETLKCIVTGIRPMSDLAARLTLAPEAPGVHTAGDSLIGDYDPEISHGSGFSKTADSVIISETQTDYTAGEPLPGGVVNPTIRIKYKVVATVSEAKRDKAAFIQIQHRLSKSQGDYEALASEPISASRQTQIKGVKAGKLYDIRTRGVSAGGIASEWSTRLGVFVNPADQFTVIDGGLVKLLLPDVRDMWITEHPAGIRYIHWRFKDPLPEDYRGVMIRAREGSGYTWDQLYPIHALPVTIVPFQTGFPSKTGVTYTFGIRAINASGSLSQNTAFVAKSFSYPAFGMAASQDAREMRWPGTITGFINNIKDHAGVGELQGTSSKTWASNAAEGITWATWTNYSRASNDLVYEHPLINAGAVVNAVVSAATIYYGDTITKQERHKNNSGDAWSAYAAIGSSPINSRYFQVKITVAGAIAKLKSCIVGLKLS